MKTVLILGDFTRRISIILLAAVVMIFIYFWMLPGIQELIKSKTDYALCCLWVGILAFLQDLIEVRKTQNKKVWEEVLSATILAVFMAMFWPILFIVIPPFGFVRIMKKQCCFEDSSLPQS